MRKEDLKQFVLDNPRLVSMKLVGNSLFILKYKKNVFFNDLWNEYLEECRGTIVDNNFNVVTRPFAKVYNYGIEKRAPVLSNNTLVTAYRKINGFMVAMTWFNNDILVSTTGSADSLYVHMAKEMMATHANWEDWKIAVQSSYGLTLMFECVHPNDPHIIPEEVGMYFIGSRENSWNSVVNGFGLSAANKWQEYAENILHCKFAESYVLTLDELIQKTKSVKHEGFVFYTEDNISSKIKSPYYLTSKWVARNPKTDKLVDMKNDFKKKVDEEYYSLIDAIRLNIGEYSAMNEQERLTWVRKFTEAL